MSVFLPLSVCVKSSEVLVSLSVADPGRGLRGLRGLESPLSDLYDVRN